MKQIYLSRGYFAIVDDEDYDYINQWKWCIQIQRPKTYYAIRLERINGKYKKHKMHTDILKNNFPDLIINNVDHKNGNGIDNRKENLRICNKSENACNRGKQKNNTSGYKGVSFDKESNKWNSQIIKNKKRYNLGRFNNIIDAAKEYNNKAIELHGEFAKLNKITE